MLAVIVLVFILVIFVAVTLLTKAQKKSKYEKALSFFKDGKYEDALKIFRELYSKGSRDRIYNYYIGLCYEKLENYEIALVEYNKVAVSTLFKPPLNEVDVHRRIAQVNMKLGNTKKAFREFRIVTLLDPGDAESFYYLGIISKNNNDLKKAVEYFENAILKKNDYTNAYLEFGKLNYELNNYKKAKNALHQAIALDPSLTEAHFYYALISEKKRIYKKSIEEFNIALEDDRFKFDSYFHLGLINMELSKSKIAFDLFEKALAFGTPNTKNLLEAKYTYANCLVQYGNIKKALMLLEEINTTQLNYRDVESKLKIYGEISKSDTLTRFITSLKLEFLDTVKALCKLLMIKIEKYSFKRGNFIEVLGSSYAGIKDEICVLHIARWTTPVGEIPIRELLEAMSKAGASIGYFITSSNFTEKAFDISNTRPLELIDKEKLKDMLKSIYV